MNRSRCTLAMTEAAATDTERWSARTARRTGVTANRRWQGLRGVMPASFGLKRGGRTSSRTGPPSLGQTPAAAASARPVSTLARCRR